MRPYHVDFEQARMRRVQAIAMARPLAWHRRAPPPPPRRGRLGPWMAAVVLCRAWRRRVRDRRELAALDYRMQRDIGVTPDEIAHEVGKPFWRA